MERIDLLKQRLNKVQHQLETLPTHYDTSRLEYERDKIMDELNELEKPKNEDYIPAPDEDENGNTDLDYGYPKEAQRRDEIEKQTKLAAKRFTDLCNTCGREYLLYEEGGIEGWTLRDFVSEAYYQYEFNLDSWYDDAKVEARKWLRFVQRFQGYLDNDIKCSREHISKYDLL